MTEQVTLYTNPMSRGRMVRWMLEEIGQPYTTEWVAYGPQMKSSEFLAINPMGKVPAIRHGDVVVSETPAIITYLADVFPEAGRAPAPAARADYYRWMFFAAGPLEAACTNKALAVEVPEERKAFVGYGSLELVLDTLEQAIKAKPFLAGETFTTADLYIASHLGISMMFGHIDQRPAFTDYVERMTNRDAYRRAVAIDNAALEASKNQAAV